MDRWYQKYILDARRKELGTNVRYRKELRAAAAKDPKVRKALMDACREDVLFWFNAFAWVYEPRPRKDAKGKPLPKTIPFITWPHQDPIIRELEESLGYCDIGVNKSRGEGLSWIGVLMATHECLFSRDGSKVGLVSSKLAKADATGDLDSLMAKVVWELEKLPPWMSGKRASSILDEGDWCYNSTEHTITFRRSNSVMTAFPASNDTARGGRYTWFLADELASWAHNDAELLMSATGPATDSRFIVSTPMGPIGPYYKFIHTPSAAAKILTAHWSQNISKNRGLYRIVHGKPVAVEQFNPLHPDYNPPTKAVQELFSRLKLKGFDLKGGVRSPWYDTQCDRPDSTPSSIARELDLDFGGSVDKYFHQEFFDAAEKHIRPAQIRGVFYASPEDTQWDFERASDGPFHLWCDLDHRLMPPRSEYVIACDVAHGSGGSHSSNSALEVLDLITKEQVLEFASNTVKPEDFADIAIGMCSWFYGAYLIWENQGPGTAFGARIQQRKFGNIYDRKVPWKSSKARIVTEPGWITTKETKEAMFEGIRSAVKRRELVIRSKELVEELHQYIRDPSGKIEHVGAKIATGGEAGLAHGDRVIAIGIALQAAMDRPQSAKRREDWAPDSDPMPGTLAYREWLADRDADPDVWDSRSTYDLTKHQGWVYS